MKHKRQFLLFTLFTQLTFYSTLLEMHQLWSRENGPLISTKTSIGCASSSTNIWSWMKRRELWVHWVIEIFIFYLWRFLQFLYVNQTFAPSPDQILKNLYECYGNQNKLTLHYSISQAWGWRNPFVSWKVIKLSHVLQILRLRISINFSLFYKLFCYQYYLHVRCFFHRKIYYFQEKWVEGGQWKQWTFNISGYGATNTM